MIMFFLGIILGACAVAIVISQCIAASSADDASERDMAPKVGIAMDDILLAMGSEGDNLPRMNLRREVAEQLGCDLP